jgi:hypothetical protein
MKTSMGQIENYCSKENIDLLWVVNPSQSDFKNGEYKYIYFKKFLNKVKIDVDLLPLMLERAKTKSLNATNLFWDIDQHCNGRGYQLIGELICESYSNKFSSNLKPKEKDSTSTITFEQNR